VTTWWQIPRAPVVGPGQVDEGVPGLVEGGDGGPGGDGLSGADLAGDHPGRAFADAPGDAGGRFGVRGMGVQHAGGEVLAEGLPGEAVVVAQVDHGSSAGGGGLAAGRASAP
jgi:hypothetical protein